MGGYTAKAGASSASSPGPASTRRTSKAALAGPDSPPTKANTNSEEHECREAPVDSSVALPSARGRAHSGPQAHSSPRGSPTLQAWPAEPGTALEADADAQDIMVGVVGRVMDRLVAKNDAQPTSGAGAPSPLPSFEGSVPCPLQPSAYISRMLKYSRCSPCNLVVAVVYLERLKKAVREGQQGSPCGDRVLRLTSHSTQRLLLTAVMLACKFLDEPVVKNRQWGLIGDLSVTEMNELELDFLWALKFSLNITRDEYDQCRATLIELDRESGLDDGIKKRKGTEKIRRGIDKIGPYSSPVVSPERPMAHATNVPEGPAAAQSIASC